MGRGHTPWGYKEVFIGCHGYFQVIWGLQITILCSKYMSIVHFQKKNPYFKSHYVFKFIIGYQYYHFFYKWTHKYATLTNVIADSSSRNCVVKV